MSAGEGTASLIAARRGAPARRWEAGANRLARGIIVRWLRRIRGGELVIREQGVERSFGRVAEPRSLRAVLQVRSPRFYRDLLRGSVGLCESYVDGLWECEDLVALTRIGARNLSGLDRLRRALAPVLIPVQRWARWLQRNTRSRARRRIAAHYDLGNELFSQFLDPMMMYSCAVFDDPSWTLEQASLAKLERVCSKLELRPEHHVVEIGTGWGGFAVFAAERYGCRVTTTTISGEQEAYARARVREAGLEDRVTVLMQDYRDLRGSYDRLVSIEMIEAVGWQYFRTFFHRCSQLLKPDGAMLLQAILIEDEAYEVEKGSRSFVKKYIFPGGCLPSMRVISQAVARATDLRELHAEDLTAHYALTLERWRERFTAAGERLAQLGYDERFRRLWKLYLSYCEGGFRERRIKDVQLLLAKPEFRPRSLSPPAPAHSPSAA